MGKAIDWATYSGDAWTRRWRELDQALAGLTPDLHAAIIDAIPARPFKALDVGCGAGSTTGWLAHERPDATIVACDISPSLIQLASDRFADTDSVLSMLGDAPAIAAHEGPFDLVFSRHGVMFFDDPVVAFERLRAATVSGGTIVFSCFQDWRMNHWASKLASDAAGVVLPSPGQEAGGFAFADCYHVQQILVSAGWIDANVRSVPFRYIVGTGVGAIDKAMQFLSEIGPAARVLDGLSDQARSAAIKRMRGTMEQHHASDAVAFPAAAWVWSARAPAQ